MLSNNKSVRKIWNSLLFFFFFLEILDCCAKLLLLKQMQLLPSHSQEFLKGSINIVRDSLLHKVSSRRVAQAGVWRNLWVRCGGRGGMRKRRSCPAFLSTALWNGEHRASQQFTAPPAEEPDQFSAAQCSWGAWELGCAVKTFNDNINPNLHSGIVPCEA